MSSGPVKKRAQTDPAKAQARKMLRTLCNFMLPLIQRASSKAINAQKIRFGTEADEFVTELEKFVSGIISCSRGRSQDIAIEPALEKWESEKDWLDNFKGTNWLWEIAAPSNEETIGAVSSAVVIMNPVLARPISLSPYYERRLHTELQDLRKCITQRMPIRLLCFEPHNGKLKISLLERAEVYNYLAPKLQANYNAGLYSRHWNEFYARYAILSHTWNPTPGELTYDDWQNGSLDDTHPKCQKLIKFCKAAWDDYGLTLGWIDTVCINKESSAELDESIRSMYTWYSYAKVCIIYLAETNTLSDVRNDPWFTRGWTFQELVARYNIKFYNKEWKQISTGKSSASDKKDPLILEEIRLATTITRNELDNIRHRASISRRMQLAAQRQVTREEDTAYCLMGIFDVSISTAYGEGAERAFFRLVEAIFRSTKDISDIFNWAGDREHGSRQPTTTSLFPSRPSNYLNRSSNEQLRPWRPIEPLTLTHLGLRIPILLMPAVPMHKVVLDHQTIGDYHATISISPFKDAHLSKVPRHYHLLDKRFSRREGLYEAPLWAKRTTTLTFGTLNVEEQRTNILIPKTCLAVLLQMDVEPLTRRPVIKNSIQPYNRIYTEKPIVFDLKKNGNDSDHGNKHYYELERSELAKHGMELVTMYL